ncbi:GNAT family N-acetyltransferase [Kaarinaea lacus]
MQCKIVENLTKIDSKSWNLIAGDNPFLRHEFLSALERHHCVGETHGWIPQHIVLHNQADELLGAVPLYLKDNSYGEFVFDWSWADAYYRHGKDYYPKLVVAVPYTPATGPRLLIAENHLDGDRRKEITATLIDKALNHARSLSVSSLHWLFTTDEDNRDLEAANFMPRMGCQFHWYNQNYRDFDDFLAQLTSRKRKQINRERRQVQQAGIELRLLHGDEISEEQWHTFHRHYTSTFQRLGGYATLSLEFFQEIGRTMPKNVIVIMAYHDNKQVASAFCARGEQALYGRHWGCDESYAGLHFETCYYQGIDYCIKEGLRLFEPGAQGEHKISRGFLPTPTWSQHWIANATFRQAIKDFLEHETKGMKHYINSLEEHSPYKKTSSSS